MMHDELIVMLDTRRADGAKQAATNLGISPQYLSDVIAGRRAPGAKILTALGLRRVVTYEPMEAE